MTIDEKVNDDYTLTFITQTKRHQLIHLDN
jgi:hypothetical protein